MSFLYSILNNNTIPIVIIAGTGIGISILIDGKIVKGYKNLAGQIGMIPITT